MTEADFEAGTFLSSSESVPVDDLNQAVHAVLCEALHLPEASLSIDPETPLLGALPELDSMGVVLVLTGLEARFNVHFADDDLDAEAFSSLGALTRFVAERID
ncbi:MAG: phosphopantetheine-binding protein [Halothiobacillaceae bacterium]|nr:phosphopantetheine-binding protein [Halothiobacillaceae bacterium]